MKLSEEDLKILVKNIQLSEKRRFANDSPKMGVARILFVKWMKERNEWEKYKKYFTNRNNTTEHFFSRAWENPTHMQDFLGETGYEYDTYLEWCDFCYSVEPILARLS